MGVECTLAVIGTGRAVPDTCYLLIVTCYLLLVTCSCAAGREVRSDPASGFSLFVKEHFASTKADLGPKTPHKDIMSELSSKWKDMRIEDTDDPPQ
eukprot:4506957-Pyramimonas_sp.AAC.1